MFLLSYVWDLTAKIRMRKYGTPVLLVCLLFLLLVNLK